MPVAGKQLAAEAQKSIFIYSFSSISYDHDICRKYSADGGGHIHQV